MAGTTQRGSFARRKFRPFREGWRRATSLTTLVSSRYLTSVFELDVYPAAQPARYRVVANLQGNWVSEQIQVSQHEDSCRLLASRVSFQAQCLGVREVSWERLFGPCW